MNPAEAGVEVYLEFLGALRESAAEYFLEGGQAVNFRAEYVDARIKGRPLSSMRPFTSKDCDIWVSDGTWKVLKRNPAVRKKRAGHPPEGKSRSDNPGLLPEAPIPFPQALETPLRTP